LDKTNHIDIPTSLNTIVSTPPLFHQQQQPFTMEEGLNPAVATAAGGPVDTKRERKRQLSVLKLSPQDLTKKMNDLKKEDLDELIKQSQEVELTSGLIAMFAIFEFQGFDPYAIIRKLVILKNEYGLTNDDLKEDIMYMIAANIYMGNLSGKTLSRRSQEGRDVIDELCQRYQVRVGTTGTGLSSDTITIPRVAGSFPVLSCKMAERLPTKDMVGQPFLSMPVPKFMRVNVFATFCPTQMRMRTRLFLLKACAAYSCDQSVVFQVGEMKKKKVPATDQKVDPKMVAADQWTFLWATSEGPVPPIYARRDFHTKMNTVGLYETLRPVVENYNTIMDDPTGIPSKAEYEADITDFITSTNNAPNLL